MPFIKSLKHFWMNKLFWKQCFWDHFRKNKKPYSHNVALIWALKFFLSHFPAYENVKHNWQNLKISNGPKGGKPSLQCVMYTRCLRKSISNILIIYQAVLSTVFQWLKCVCSNTFDMVYSINSLVALWLLPTTYTSQTQNEKHSWVITDHLWSEP
jgi:hypothetical protein